MTPVLKYLMAGILMTEPTTDITDCINRMEALPYVERVRARCVGEHMTIHARDLQKPTEAQEAPEAPVLLPPPLPTIQTTPCADYYAFQDALLRGEIPATCDDI